MGPPAYFPSKGRCAADFYYSQKSIALAGFELATFGSSGKHINHYTTEATVLVWHLESISVDCSRPVLPIRHYKRCA
jgi:hypothetical protein